MKRRTFAAFAGAVASWPVTGWAQLAPGKPQRLAFVHTGLPTSQMSEAAGPPWVRTFFKTLRLLGHAEGRNLVVERRSGEGDRGGLDRLVAEVVALNPDVVVANGPLPIVLRAATTTIPIVAIIPNWETLVPSLSRPGGNLTGVSVNAGGAIFAKVLQILKEAVPTASRVAVLGSAGSELAGYRNAAGQLNIELIDASLKTVNEEQLRSAFAAIANKVDAAVVSGEGSLLANRQIVVELARAHRLPVIYPYRDYAEAGGLMAYAPDLEELARRMAENVHQILTGTRPGDIPIYQPTRFVLVLNANAATGLGLQLPPVLLARADDVLE